MIPWIDKVMKELLARKVNDKFFDGKPYDREIVKKQDAEIVRTILVEGSVEQIKEWESKIATLEAKVFVYESLIQKSNFAPVTEGQPKVIRCRDCVHNKYTADSGNANCELYYGMTDQMGFCHKGERR